MELKIITLLVALFLLNACTGSGQHRSYIISNAADVESYSDPIQEL